MGALHSSICKLSASLRILSWEDGWVNMDDFPSWSSSTILPQGSHILELNLQSCKFQRCPEWIGQLHNLCKLSISVNEVADGVRIVEDLPSLAYLHWESGGKKEESVVIPGCGSSGEFKALKELIFKCKRASLIFEAGALPNLQKLLILFRYNMARQFLPHGIQHLPAPTLEEITLIVDKNNRKVKGSENWSDQDQRDYQSSYGFRDRLKKHATKLKPMLKGAFKPHHPGAYISIDLQEHMYRLKNDEVDYESVDDLEYEDVQYYMEEDNEEEDDEEGPEDTEYYTEDDNEQEDDDDGVEDAEYYYSAEHMVNSHIDINNDLFVQQAKNGAEELIAVHMHPLVA